MVLIPLLTSIENVCILTSTQALSLQDRTALLYVYMYMYMNMNVHSDSNKQFLQNGLLLVSLFLFSESKIGPITIY